MGSREEEVRREIGRALARPASGSLEVTLEPVGSSSSLQVGIRARLDRPPDGRRVEVLVALYQDGLTTAVERGGNARRTLENDLVVRRLERAFALLPDGGRTAEGEVVFHLDPQWPTARLGVVAFLQDADSRAILGAASAEAAAATRTGGEPVSAAGP